MKNKTQTSEGGEVIKTADNKLNYNMYQDHCCLRQLLDKMISML